MQQPRARVLLQWGGVGAILASVTFLFTLIYVFVILASVGLTEAMLDAPEQLLPWVADHANAYAGLYWIFLCSVVVLLPAPLALDEWVKMRNPALARIALTAGLIGITLGVIGPLVNVGATGLLARAYVTPNAADPATLTLLSAIVGEIGLLLRLISDLFLGIWLGVAGLLLINGPDRARWFGWYSIVTALLIAFVVVGKALTLFDLEPVLGLFLAIAYGWLGVILLRARRQLPVLEPITA